MDDRRFDALTRSFASGRNRRQLLRAVLGLGGGIVAGSIAHDTEAARRPKPEKPAVRCPGIQIVVDGVCTCPSGTQCGPDCCPDEAECCDNACCYGTCYGEELCCPTGHIACDGECGPWECCSDDDCGINGVCDPEQHTCTCIPNCDGITCGDDGCGGSCGVCPSGQFCYGGACVCERGYLCSDGLCHDCCSDADCAESHNGDVACWTCTSSGQCGYGYNFCPLPGGGTGVCGGSSSSVLGQCIECGTDGPFIADKCDATVPCCDGYECDFAFGSYGQCRTDIG